MSIQKRTTYELLKEVENVHDHSQCHLGDLLFGKVQRVIVDCDAIFALVLPWRQIGPQNTVVHHIEEGSDAVPALVIEPDLRKKLNTNQFLFLGCKK